MPIPDFKSDPLKLVTFQVAETLGKTPDEILETFTSEDLFDWMYFLNSTFSQRGLMLMLNGWLVHVVRSIMAGKHSRPKFADSLYPLDKQTRAFYDQVEVYAKHRRAEEAENAAEKDKKDDTVDCTKIGDPFYASKPALPTTVAGAEIAARIIRERRKQNERDFLQGKTIDARGLKVYEHF